jgi:hypothetical protein
VAAGDDVPLYFCSHLFSRNAELRSMFAIQMSAQRDKPVAVLGLTSRTSTSSATWCPPRATGP